MRINHNIAALGAYRYLSGANKSLSSSLEKLSSGLRINRASDDAAGMAISEKMKAQIRGLSQASRNSLDAVSLIQTAEGALNEVHSMLQRMRELAVQSANGTLTSEDREKNQAEIDQLTQAIDIVSRDTEFNTKKLLRGSDMQVGNTFVFGVDRNISRSATAGVVSYTNMTPPFAGPAEAVIDFSAETITAGKVVEIGDRVYEFVDGNPAQEGNIAVELQPTGTALDRLSTVINENMPTGISSVAYDDIAKTYTVQGESNYYVMSNVSKSITLSFVGVPSPGDSLSLRGTKFVFANSADTVNPPNVKVDMGGVQNVADVMTKLAEAVQTNLPGGASFTNMVGGGIREDRYEFKLLLDDLVTEAEMEAFNINADSSDMFVSVQIGANSSQSLILQVNNMSAAKLGISFDDSGLPIEDFTHMAARGVPVISPDDAEEAIDIIENAIDMVSQERAKLGSYQNRLEHTIKNLEVSEENLTASLSRIEDADMALEMSNYTKFNILVQSGTAMLAQANQIPQSVLQLLK